MFSVSLEYQIRFNSTTQIFSRSFVVSSVEQGVILLKAYGKALISGAVWQGGTLCRTVK